MHIWQLHGKVYLQYGARPFVLLCSPGQNAKLSYLAQGTDKWTAKTLIGTHQGKMTEVLIYW